MFCTGKDGKGDKAGGELARLNRIMLSKVLSKSKNFYIVSKSALNSSRVITLMEGKDKSFKILKCLSPVTK